MADGTNSMSETKEEIPRANLDNGVTEKIPLMPSVEINTQSLERNENNVAHSENVMNGHNDSNASDSPSQGSEDVCSVIHQPLNSITEDTQNMILENKTLRYA